MTVQWMSLAASDQNGVILRYNVYFHKLTGGPTAQSNVTEPTRWLTIDWLDAFTTYAVTVSASTFAGEGPQSTPVIVTTNEDGMFYERPDTLMNASNRLLFLLISFQHHQKEVGMVKSHV